MKYFKSEAFRNAIFATLVVLAFSAMPSFAQMDGAASGNTGSDAKTSAVTLWKSVSGILDLLVGVGGVIGIFIIVWKLKSGDEAAKGQIVMLLGALFLWYMRGIILHTFGITALG